MRLARPWGYASLCLEDPKYPLPSKSFSKVGLGGKRWERAEVVEPSQGVQSQSGARWDAYRGRRGTFRIQKQASAGSAAHTLRS